MKFHRPAIKGFKDDWAEDVLVQVRLALHDDKLELPSLVNMTKRDLEYLALAFERLDNPSLSDLDRKLAEFP